MKERPTQHFTEDYVERCRELTPDQILEFLDDFQKLILDTPEKCKLISLKIEPSLLRAFQTKAKLSGIVYQTQIKKLMREWISNDK